MSGPAVRERISKEMSAMWGRIRGRALHRRTLPLQFGYEALGDIREAEERMRRGEELSRGGNLAVIDGGEGGGAAGAAPAALEATCAGSNGETYVLRAAVPTLGWLDHQRYARDMGLNVRLRTPSATCTCLDFKGSAARAARAAPCAGMPPKRGCCKHVLALLSAWCERADASGALAAMVEAVSGTPLPPGAEHMPALRAAAAAFRRLELATPPRPAAARRVTFSPPTRPTAEVAPPVSPSFAGMWAAMHFPGAARRIDFG